MSGSSVSVAWVAAGSNLGDREAYLESARSGLRAAPGIDAVATGPVEETKPLGGLDQPAYMNQMYRVETRLEARALLELCHQLERAAGRQRPSRWCSRTLDLDLVRYADLLCDLPDLTLPHPGLRDRTFWAREIAELESHG